MTFPLINHLYEYNNKNVIVWASDIFNKVYLRCPDKKDNFEYFTIGWFKFFFKAKHIKNLGFKDNDIY